MCSLMRRAVHDYALREPLGRWWAASCGHAARALHALVLRYAPRPKVGLGHWTSQRTREDFEQASA